MDVLVRLPLVFVTDLMLANRACSDLFPGFQYVSSLLPMDLVHTAGILFILIILLLDVKEMTGAYQLVLSWIMFDLSFHAFHWMVGLDPENYFLELFLTFFFISIGAYAFKRYYEESEVVMLMAALFFYLCLEETPTRMINYLKYALFITLYVVTHSGNGTEKHANIELFFKYDSVVLQRTYLKFGLYWIIIVVAQPLTWFDLSEWNLWNGIFAEGMSTPTRVCAMTGLLLVLTKYAFDAFNKFIPGRNNFLSMPNSLTITWILFTFLLNERVWELKPEKRAELVRIYLLMHLVLFLEKCYDDLNFCEYVIHNQLYKTRAYVFSFLMFLISIYLFYFVWSALPALCFRSLMLFTSIVHLMLKMSTQLSMAVWCSSRWTPNNRKLPYLMLIVMFINKGNSFGKELIIALCKLWMTFVHAARWLNVDYVMDYVYVDLVKGRAVSLKCARPNICVRSLPRASEGQLTANDDICIMCRENMEEACVTPCGHYYHPHCLIKWLHVNDKCPMCQTALY